MPLSSFLAGGGDSGDRIRNFAWEGTVLGRAQAWPPALATLVGVMLASDHAMLIAWGPSLVALYNDAHAALIADRHPLTLGRPLFTAWPEVKEQIEPLFREAMRGEANRLEDVIIPIARGGVLTNAHFSMSFTPIRDGEQIAGVLCLSTETTKSILAGRRKAALLDLSDRLRLAEGPRARVAAGVETLGLYLGANRVGYGEVQDDGSRILLETSFVDGVAPLHGTFPLESFGGAYISRQRQGQTVYSDDVTLDGGDVAVWSEIETRAFASVPLVRDGDLRASLYVNFRQPHAWSADEISLIEEVAARIWDSLERARAEEALRASEARFRAAVAAVHGILWTNTARGEMAGEQAAWGVLTGQTPEQYQGHGWAAAVHPDDAQPTLDAWNAAVAERRPFIFEHRLRRFDGAWRSFSIRAIPVMDPSGEIQEWVGVHADNTDQRAAESQLRKLNGELAELVAEERAMNLRLMAQGAALQSAQASLQAIFGASSEGLTLCRMIRDTDGTAIDYQVIDVNPAHRALTGATREQMLAKPVSQVAPPIDPRWIETADAAVRTDTTQTFEVRSPATGRWLDIHISRVSPDVFVQTFIDVTSRHNAEEQRARIVAEMNHRVMNNFQMVASVLDLQSRRSGNPDVRDQLATAVQRVHVLAELHERLAFAPDLGKVDFDVYLSAVCERLRGLIDDPHRIELTLWAEKATLDAAAAVPLGFVVNELVTNAIKYAFPAPSSGEISVSFFRETADFVLRVADGGAGLPKEVEAKGTGLGMRLVGQFVRQIGGVLDVRHTPGVEYSVRFAPDTSSEQMLSR